MQVGQLSCTRADLPRGRGLLLSLGPRRSLSRRALTQTSESPVTDPSSLQSTITLPGAAYARELQQPVSRVGTKFPPHTPLPPYTSRLPDTRGFRQGSWRR